MTETEFLKIAECKTAMKGSFKGTIIKASDLKAGSNNGKDWTKKIFTIEDESGTADLVAWGEEIQQFKIGYLYEIVNPWWKTYVDKQNVPHITVQIGNYGSAKVVGSANTEAPKGQEQLPKAEGSQPAPKQEAPNISQSNGRTEDLDEGTANRIKQEAILLIKIHNTVQKTIGESWQKDAVNLFTQLIYQKYFGDKN